MTVVEAKIDQVGELLLNLSQETGLNLPQITDELMELLLRSGDNTPYAAFFNNGDVAKITNFTGDLKTGGAELVRGMAGDVGFFRAWEVLPPHLGIQVQNLRVVSTFLGARNVDPVLLRNEISNLGHFQQDFINSLGNAIGETPFPKITNKLPVSTDGSLLGRFENGVFVRDASSNADIAGVWDYIISLDGEIIVGRKHSWMSGGADVLAAGELKWNNGVLVDINNSSGTMRLHRLKDSISCDYFSNKGLMSITLGLR